jgi:hypothetical protein
VADVPGPVQNEEKRLIQVICLNRPSSDTRCPVVLYFLTVLAKIQVLAAEYSKHDVFRPVVLFDFSG